MDTFANWSNPVSGKACPWEIGKDQDLVEKSLSHLSNDSFFTLKILKVDASWLERVAGGEFGEGDLQPGLSKYIRLTNDVAERMIKNAEDVAHDGVSVESLLSTAFLNICRLSSIIWAFFSSTVP